MQEDWERHWSRALNSPPQKGNLCLYLLTFIQIKSQMTFLFVLLYYFLSVWIIKHDSHKQLKKQGNYMEKGKNHEKAPRIMSALIPSLGA